MFEAAAEKARDIYFNGLGITREYPELKVAGTTLMLAFSILDERKHHTEIRGHYPPPGIPAIAISNHSSERDSVKAVTSFRKRGRTIRCFVRDSLLDLRIEETQEILDATGKPQNDLDQEPYYIRWVKAWAMKSEGSIPIKRGSKMPLAAIRTALETMDNHGTFVGSFLQQTRIPEGDLRDLFEGAAFLAVKRPDTLIVPIGNSDNPDLFNIGEFYTARQAQATADFEIEGLGETQRLTIFMAGTVAPLLPVELKDRWFDGQRQEAIDNFILQNEEAAAERKANLEALKAARSS